MSTTLALSAAANAQSAAALASANAARDTACQSLINSYQPKGASVSEMREYAACVQRLHPEPIPADATTVLKFAVVILLLSMPVGAWIGYRSHLGGDVMSAVMGAIGGLLASGLGMFTLVAVIAGVRFVVGY